MDTPVTLAVTMGDPAGIGPEIAVKALAGAALPRRCRVFVIGDMAVMRQAKRYTESSATLHAMSSAEDLQDGCVNVLDMHCIAPGDFSPGTENAHCGRASYEYVLKGISLATQGLIHGVVTNPINKTALKKAGINFPGHTEIFAHETATTNASMVFMLDAVSVIFVTTHCAVKEALERIDRDRVYEKTRALHGLLQSTGIDKPRIAVAGLNPHAGEGGLFGSEEILHIIPAIARAVTGGIAVTGPLPPDTVFMRAFRGEFDGVVSMLHDHGFTALKSKEFTRGVNLTAGLPIVRTSVGHGTAFDIAGTGAASDASLRAAIDVAYRMATVRFHPPDLVPDKKNDSTEPA